MKDHSQRAIEFFEQGYNCSQSVVAAFCEEMNIDMETVIKLSSSFGGGMGRLREVCGAVSGAFMIAGMKYGYADPQDQQAKTQHYQLIQDFAEKFKNENSSIICRELLGLKEGPDSPVPETRSTEYYQKRPCIELVGCAAKILDEIIREKEKEKPKNN